MSARGTRPVTESRVSEVPADLVDDILSWDFGAAPAAATSPPGPAIRRGPKWHLGFDCATKTFAFSLSRIDLGAFEESKARLRTRVRAAIEVLRRAAAMLRDGGDAVPRAAGLVREVAPVLEAADQESRAFVRLADGETVDLFPDRADDDIATVERLRAVVRYVNGRVRPAVRRLVPAGESVRVVIEFQMGPNARSRAVAAALVALFADDDVIIVGPTLKNKIATCEEGRYCYFAERYASSYGANKAHAKYNFARFEDAFGTEIPATRPASLRGHIADSFMQVIGHLVFGSEENAASLF